MAMTKGHVQHSVFSGAAKEKGGAVTVHFAPCQTGQYTVTLCVTGLDGETADYILTYTKIQGSDYEETDNNDDQHISVCCNVITTVHIHLYNVLHRGT